MPQAEVVVNEFEIGRSPTGLAAFVTWVNAQKTAGSNFLLSSKIIERYDTRIIYGVMTKTIVRAGNSTTLGANHRAAEFEISQNPNGLTSLANWMMSRFTGFVAPAAPGLSSIVAGALSAQGTYFVKNTYVTTLGETTPSVESSLAVANLSELVVASPSTPAAILGDTVTGWNTYISQATGTEKKQNATPLALGSTYTVTAALLTVTAPPGTNATILGIVQNIKIIQRFDEVMVYITQSN